LALDVYLPLMAYTNSNLPHRGGGFIASVAQGDVVVFVYMKRGD
jgi:hypothetical protein